MAFLQCPDAGREAEPALEAEGSWAGPVTWGCGIRPPPRPPPQGHPEAGLPRRLLASFRRPESWPRPDAGARAAQGGPESGPPAAPLSGPRPSPSTCCVWPPRGPPCFQPRGAPRSLPCAGTAGGEEACALALFWRGRPSVRERGWPLCPTRPERSRWPRPENRGLRGCFRKNGGFPLRWMGPRQWVLTLRVPSRLDVPLRVWHARIMMGPWPPSVP